MTISLGQATEVWTHLWLSLEVGFLVSCEKFCSLSKQTWTEPKWNRNGDKFGFLKKKNEEKSSKILFFSERKRTTKKHNLLVAKSSNKQNFLKSRSRVTRNSRRRRRWRSRRPPRFKSRPRHSLAPTARHNNDAKDTRDGDKLVHSVIAKKLSNNLWPELA